MDNEHLAGGLASFDACEAVGAPSDVRVTLYAVGSFSTLALMAFTEQFGDLPSAVAAFASGWCILRL